MSPPLLPVSFEGRSAEFIVDAAAFEGGSVGFDVEEAGPFTDTNATFLALDTTFKLLELAEVPVSAS